MLDVCKCKSPAELNSVRGLLDEGAASSDGGIHHHLLSFIYSKMDLAARLRRYRCNMCSKIIKGVEVKCSTCQRVYIRRVKVINDINVLNRVGVGPGRGGSRLQLLPHMDGSEDSVEEESWGRRGREREGNDRRTSTSAAAIHETLQGNRSRMVSDNHNLNDENRGRRDPMFSLNWFNHTINVYGVDDHGRGIYSMGDYFFGSNLDALLRHLAEIDPNQYGTPPTKKEAIDAMPTVKIHSNVECSVCLEDFKIDSEAKEMPCKHKFHHGCISPWLELHSSCPVCRYQLPDDVLKIGASCRVSGTGNTNAASNQNHGRDEDAVVGAIDMFSVP